MNEVLRLSLSILVGGLIISIVLFFVVILGCLAISQAFRILEWLDDKLNWHILPWN